MADIIGSLLIIMFYYSIIVFFGDSLSYIMLFSLITVVIKKKKKCSFFISVWFIDTNLSVVLHSGVTMTQGRFLSLFSWFMQLLRGQKKQGLSDSEYRM